MIDIHCHILPGIDDGAAAEDVAQDMAQLAVADGITQVVATPHVNDRYEFDPALNRQLRDALQDRLGSDLTILLGCELRLTEANVAALLTRPEDFTLNGRNYLLVELDYSIIPPNTEELLSRLLARGLKPILAHPERHPLLAANPERLAQWVAAGCFAQITAGALTGQFGRKVMQSARKLLARGLAHFLASDAHNAASRPPLLSAARKQAATQMGEETAHALLEGNPRAAIEGLPLPWQPPIVSSPARKRWSWFSPPAEGVR